VVPVFWLASEDHDFQEINHAYMIKRDGEVGRVRFRWHEEGHPVADLPINEQVQRAYETYWDRTVSTSYSPQVREAFAYRAGEGWSEWQARVWSALFGAHGLVVVEPHIVRAAVPGFFSLALKSAAAIRLRLKGVAQELRAAGYTPALTSESAGALYTFDGTGQRVRVSDPQIHVADVASNPERYSTDAALRPLLADASLPVVASVLGPGELAYQAMLKPLYELFEIPQPLLHPRQSYTIVSQHEAERLAAYQTSPRAVLTESIDVDVVLGNLVPEPERELFDSARRGIERALSLLRAYVEEIDDGLGRTWEQTVYYAKRAMNKLEERALKARTGQLGFSKGELRSIQNALLPRGRLQERVLPLSHFMNRHGPGFIDTMLEVGELDDFRHHVVTMCDAHEDGDA
jgi:bacillithiol biosynthesis cysteine-adding enzyme BshC